MYLVSLQYVTTKKDLIADRQKTSDNFLISFDNLGR